MIEHDSAMNCEFSKKSFKPRQLTIKASICPLPGTQVVVSRPAEVKVNMDRRHKALFTTKMRSFSRRKRHLILAVVLLLVRPTPKPLKLTMFAIETSA